MTARLDPGALAPGECSTSWAMPGKWAIPFTQATRGNAPVHSVGKDLLNVLGLQVGMHAKYLLSAVSRGDKGPTRVPTVTRTRMRVL